SSARWLTQRASACESDAMMRTLTLAVLLAAGCGGKKPATSTTEQPAAHHEEHEDLGMPEMTKFHDVLAPRWHAEKGPKRMEDTCAALPELQTDADALAKATPPANADKQKWSTTTLALVNAVSSLDATCKAKDTSKFEAVFQRVHESFHGVM